MIPVPDLTPGNWHGTHGRARSLFVIDMRPVHRGRSQGGGTMAGTETIRLDVDAGTAEAFRRLFCDGTPASASEVATALARAALAEYALQASGERVPGGVRDLRELRLRLLAEHLPGGLPTDGPIAQFFHLTPAQARNLVNGARARYPAELAAGMKQAAIDALRRSDKGDADTIRITASPSLAAYLSDIVVTDSNAPPLAPRKDGSNRWDVSRKAAEVLCRRLGIDVADVRGLRR
jgi:hypothetical protein